MNLTILHALAPAALVLTISALFPLRAAEAPPGAKTYALVVGISKYQKLSQDLWLQYPDADAKALSAHLASPRGGGVPPDRMLVLTNEQATTAAVRSGLEAFLKQRPGKDDTVFVLIAGHGTVDAGGAYILTYDSDPGNLAGTALPMAELHSMVEQALLKVGHVVLLADVCRAATIAGQKTTALGGIVAQIGEAPGEMLGLMAARPKELSIEGPDFGGGHGAFTWSVLQGLEGAADSDHDGFVTAGELIDFVTTDVPRTTHNRQHPRDFGNMENTTKLADLSKPGIALP
ncbi:MAG TPA: caspase family protein [Bryobacteraceae bacterium]|nr:caspase family protein [Bryobacteraceae bacterium]